MNLITSAQARAHITPAQDAHWHKAWLGIESCIFDGSFAPTIVTNNEVRIGEGVGSIQGRFFDVEVGTYDTVTIDNGAQGQNRIDLICLKVTVDSGTGTQSGAWEVIKGTNSSGQPSEPTVTLGDLDAGDSEAYLPVLKVNISGLNISNIDVIANVWTPSADVIVNEGTDANGWYIRDYASGWREAYQKMTSPTWGSPSTVNNVQRKSLTNLPTIPSFTTLVECSASGNNSGVWAVGSINASGNPAILQQSVNTSSTNVVSVLSISLKGWR